MRRDQIPLPEGTTHWRVWRLDSKGKQKGGPLSHEDDLTEEDQFPVRLLSKARLRDWWGPGRYILGFFRLEQGEDGLVRCKLRGRSRPIGIKGPGEGEGLGVAANPAPGAQNGLSFQELVQMQAMQRLQREEEAEVRRRDEEAARDARRREREEESERRQSEREEELHRIQLEMKKLELELRLNVARSGQSTGLDDLRSELLGELQEMKQAIADRDAQLAAQPSAGAAAPMFDMNALSSLVKEIGPFLMAAMNRTANDNTGPSIASAPLPSPYQPRAAEGTGGQ